jgi:hypothetical protein
MNVDKASYSIDRTVVHDIPQSQVLLNFVNDVGAEAFEEWFSEEGEQMFYNYVTDYFEENK